MIHNLIKIEIKHCWNNFEPILLINKYSSMVSSSIFLYWIINTIKQLEIISKVIRFNIYTLLTLFKLCLVLIKCQFLLILSGSLTFCIDFWFLLIFVSIHCLWNTLVMKWCLVNQMIVSKTLIDYSTYNGRIEWDLRWFF